jgi:protein TonB
MRFFVVAPLAAASLLLLLLLMVQLAGINVSKIALQPIVLSAPVFDFTTASFSEASENSQQEPQLEALEPIEKSASETAPQMDLSEPITEQTTEPLVQTDVALDLLQIDIDIQLPATENLLADVVITKPPVSKKAKPISKLKTAKKSLKQVTSKKSVSKNNLESSAKSNLASQSSSKSATIIARASSPISKVKPKYPSRARRRGIEGEVTVSFIVNKNGSVAKNSIRVIDAKPAKVFNKAVYLAVAKWRFEKNVRSYRTKQRLVFSLKN